MKHAAVAISFGLLAFACSSPPADDDVRATPQGVYRTGSGGASADLVLSGTKYRSIPEGCNEGSCVERGTYEVAGDRLRFVVDGTGRTYEVPFQVLETRSTPQVKTADALVQGGGPIVADDAPPLLSVQSFELVDREYQLLEVSAADKAKMWDAAKKLTACVLDDYECRLVVSGEVPGATDIRETFGSMLRRGRIDPFAGNRPGLFGRTENGRILIFDDSYSNVNEVTVTLLHELGHVAGIGHASDAESADWDRVIRETCLSPQRIRECQSR